MEIFYRRPKKDLVIHKGFNIYPSEVEAVLCDHPDISDAGVIGVPDREYGEQVCAFVVLKEGAQASKKEIQSFCQERLARYKDWPGLPQSRGRCGSCAAFPSCQVP